MTANVNVTKLLFKRGNTVQNANYTGINGEITVDTQAKTLRIHDGVTAGGNVITAGGVVGSYSNTNAAAYIPTDPTITSLQSNAATQAVAINTVNANIGAFQTYANITLSTVANAASQETQINIINANVTAANAAISSLQSNAGSQATSIDTINANVGAYQTYANANAATQTTGIDTINANLGSFQTYANIHFGDSNYGNTNVAAYLGAFNGNILPAANVTYSLGSEIRQWKDLWVSNNTIYIGNTPIRVDGTTLLVNGAPVSGGTYSNTNVAAYLLGNITTGNIKSGNLAATGNTVTNVRHWDSAGANLYVWFNAASTPELVTLGNFGNIAGWTVSVSDGNSATVTETNPAGYFSISTDAGLTGSGSLTFTSPDYQGQTPAPLTVSSGSSTWTFETDGDLIVPRDIFGTGADPLVIQNTSSGPAYLELPIAPSTNAVYLANQDPTGNVVIRTGDFGSENDWTFGYNGRLNLPGNVTNGSSHINFVANSSGDGNGYSTIELRPDADLNTDQYIVVDPTGGEPGHIHLRAGGTQDASSADLFLGGELTFVRVSDTSGIVTVRTTNVGDPNITLDWRFQPDGNLYFPGIGDNRIGESEPGLVVSSDNSVVLQSNNGGVSNEWTFGTDGNLTVPGNINYANGVSILSGIGGAVNGNIVVGDSQIQFVANSSGDGYGLSTIRLVPYTPGYDSAIIIIDPTYPNHIHMRAGFEQDNAAANLFLGGEASHFNVEEGANPNVSIRSNYYTWKFGTDGRLQLPEIGESSSEIFTGSGGISIKSPQYTELRYSSTDPGNVSPTLNTEGYIWITNDGAHIQNYHGGQFNLEWLFGTDGNLTIPGNINYGNGVSILDGVGGAVTFGNTIAIGYSTGTVSQGSEAVAVGRLAGNVNQSAAAVAVGRAAGRDNQGIEAVSIGADTGQQNQGNYAIAIGSVTAYLNQGTGAVAIGTSAGSVNQGTNAIAIGTGAGTGNQGNNSIILNATGSALEQTTDNTFTVKPIRNASSSNVLYYDSTTGEITYDTAGAGSYGNTEVAAYLPTYSGNVGAARVQVTNAVDFMYGGFPYMGWQLSGSDTLKLRTNIASGDYTNDAVIVDRQSLAVNVVATLSAGNIITTSGVFWSNGTAYSTGGGTYGNTEVAAYLTTYTGNIAAGNVNVTSTVNAANIVTSGTSGNISGVNVISANTFVFAANGVNILSVAGGTYGNTEVAAYLLTWPNIDSNILDATSANITTLRANNFSTANAVISGGYISALTNASIISGTITTLNSTGGNITTLRATNFGTANAVITGGYINSLANLTATTAVLTNLSTGNAVISGGYISALTNAYITTSAITNFSTANAVITGGYASGLANVTATGNVTAGNLIGYGSNTSIIAGAYTSTFDNVGNVILPNVFVSGNTTAMGIAAGYAPNRPAFRVYGNGAVPIWHNTANVNLKGSAIAVDHNQGNYFNSTNGKFTAPVSGLYMTTLQARVGDNNGLNQIAVLKNGNNSGANVVCFWETDTNTGTATHFGTSGVVLLSPGDFLSANILAGNINFDGNDSWTVTYLG